MSNVEAVIKTPKVVYVKVVNVYEGSHQMKNNVCLKVRASLNSFLSVLIQLQLICFNCDKKHTFTFCIVLTRDCAEQDRR